MTKEEYAKSLTVFLTLLVLIPLYVDLTERFGRLILFWVVSFVRKENILDKLIEMKNSGTLASFCFLFGIIITSVVLVILKISGL